jgi:segregation and condensation protein A
MEDVLENQEKTERVGHKPESKIQSISNSQEKTERVRHKLKSEILPISNSQENSKGIGHKPESKIQSISNSQEKTERVGQEQIHKLLFDESLSWQEIIYDLINTEQLSPWDVDISLLANKYLEKVRKLEEANFFISSKVLFAASLLLRLKSDIILNSDLVNLDSFLFGKKEEKKYEQERIELDEDIPELIPRTPLPRMRKVTLDELMSSLGKAIKTENRRIKKQIILKNYEREINVAMPKRSVRIQDKISEIYKNLGEFFLKREKLTFSEFMTFVGGENGASREDRILSFVSLLHLDNQHKIWLEQEGHFEEIWMMLKKTYNIKKKEEMSKLSTENK